MADRFPSIEDIDSGNAEVQGDASFNALDDDPSDFLARERAALGEDANQFSTGNDQMASVEDGDDDLLGGGGGDTSSYQPAPTNNDIGDFESSFPTIDTQNEAVAPGGTITGSALPINPGASLSDVPEPEVVREWRERRDLAIQHRDQVSADKKAETVKQAHQAIDDFYENYNNKKEKGIAQTRKEAEEFLRNREDTTSGGTSWERISKLVDLTGKGATGGGAGSGKAKFRELLVNLRKDEKAPGATGI
ncbi:Clathrin light chain [Elsinoe australis]|uniref:Clathrin light chain n=1 Tax=Elsinoe australis TaxID=40998 RepID=A0A2P7Z2V6_9PEZI|nr:Clathrin light chain [Elsinoe australis]